MGATRGAGSQEASLDLGRQLSDIQRARILAATVDIVCENGAPTRRSRG
jgi:hypothetical protein